VLTAQRTWTVLATTPPTEWHESTPLYAADPAPLEPIANRLVDRARRILTPPPDDSAAPPAAARR
jgi:hypothetical protein